MNGPDSPLRRTRWPHHVVMVLIVLCLPFGFHRADSAQPAEDSQAGLIILVLSGDESYYKTIAAGIERALADSNRRVVSRFINDLNLAEIKANADMNDTYIAIGTDAASQLVKRLPAEVPLVYGITDITRVPELFTRRRTSGVSMFVSVAEQVRLIDRAQRDVRSIGLLFDSRNQASRRLLEQMREAAPDHWSVYAEDMAESRSFAEATRKLLSRNPQWIWTAADRAVFKGGDDVATLFRLALRRNTPVFGFSKNAVSSGAVLGIHVAPDAQSDAVVEVIRLVDRDRVERFLRGDRPNEPGLHRGAAFEFGVNQALAGNIGLRLSEELVAEADFKN